MRRSFLLLVLALSAGCLVPPGVEEAIETPFGSTPVPRGEPPVVRFLAFGDFGFPDGRHVAAARAMERACASAGCDLALLLGDNLYPNGPRSATDPDLARVFEAPFANLSFPFYASLGNHDVRREAGNGSDSGDHFVAYAERSDKWRMPARSYAFSEAGVFFVALDLTPFYMDRAMDEDAQALLAWLDERTRSEAYERATWRVAFAHFPYASSGKHGDAGRYDGEPGAGNATRALLEGGVCGRFDLYLAGHDHHLEWLAPRASCAGTELVVSGAAGEARPLERDAGALFATGDATGFFWFEARGGTLTGRAYDEEAEVLYERAVEKRG